MSRYTSSFAPYTPPPDDPTRFTLHSASSKSQSRLGSYPAYAYSQKYETSYQFGGVPTLGASASNETYHVEDSRQNQWATRYGWRVDVLAAFTYVLGPVSALFVLVFETYNDYVRFHAYQSALLTTPLLLIRILASLLQLPLWVRTFLSVVFWGDAQSKSLSRGLHWRAFSISPAQNWHSI